MELKLKKTELKTLSMDLSTLPADLTPMVAGGTNNSRTCNTDVSDYHCASDRGVLCPTGGATTCVVEN